MNEDVDVQIVYKTKTMLCIRFTLQGEDRIVLMGVTQDTKEPVMVGSFMEKNGEHVFYPTGVGWQATDVEELIEAFEHFNSGV